jgi:hypothetical protein
MVDVISIDESIDGIIGVIAHTMKLHWFDTNRWKKDTSRSQFSKNDYRREQLNIGIVDIQLNDDRPCSLINPLELMKLR